MSNHHFNILEQEYIWRYAVCTDRPDGTSAKSASGAGGMEFKSQADQISHTMLTTRHRFNLDVWALTQSRGDRHRSLVTPERVFKRV